MTYLNELDRHADDPHVKPINDYVRELRKKENRFVPFVSPRYGGVNARLLAVHKSPGVKTKPSSQGGTGFLDVDNPDQAAKRHGGFLEKAGIDLSDMLSWNSLPWFDADFDDPREWNAGADALNEIIDKLDNLSVVMLHGNEAHDMWGVLRERHRATAERFSPIETRSLGYALVNRRHKSQPEIDAENARLTRDFASAARRLRHAPKVGTRSYVAAAEAGKISPPTMKSSHPAEASPTRSKQARPYNPQWDEDWGREWPLPPNER